MPTDRDCPPDSDRLMHATAHDRAGLHGFVPDQAIVNLVLAAGVAVDSLSRLTNTHQAMCQCKPCLALGGLTRALMAIETAK